MKYDKNDSEKEKDDELRKRKITDCFFFVDYLLWAFTKHRLRLIRTYEFDRY